MIGQESINNLSPSVHGLPFAIKAKYTLVYTGYFWPSYSYASCDCIVIYTFITSIENKIHLNLDHLGLIQGQVIEYNRKTKEK